MLSNEVSNFLQSLVGKECCRQRVGSYAKLSLGFGKKIYHQKINHLDNFYGEWELGSYRAAWRIICQDKIILASKDLFSEDITLDDKLQQIKLGRIEYISISHYFDIKVQLDNATTIEFLCCSSDNDDIFHIMNTTESYLGFQPIKGWHLEN